MHSSFDIVDRWLLISSSLSCAGMYNPAGRGFPDISAQSHNFQVVLSGTVTGVSGTSASTPVVAGMVRVVNTTGSIVWRLGFDDIPL